MKKLKCLIIGYGSSGRRYASIISKITPKKNIFILTRNQNCTFQTISDLKQVTKIEFSLVIIASETYKHYGQLKFIEENFKKKLILVEKPIFHKNKKINIKNNKVFVGYNLRFDPMIIFLKKYIKNKKIIMSFLNCFSYLPNWRKNNNYKNSYSSEIKKGGGVTRDLSHEIDLATYLFHIKKIKFAANSKISNLQINSDDFASMLAIGKNNSKIMINLNYFSDKEIRQIYLKVSNETIEVDLISRIIIINKKNSKKKIFFKKQNNQTYISLVKDLLNQKKIICNYQQGLKVIGLISKFKFI